MCAIQRAIYAPLRSRLASWYDVLGNAILTINIIKILRHVCFTVNSQEMDIGQFHSFSVGVRTGAAPGRP